ncbi:MAG: rhodanese-like domain-containing protein, partial [Candidatus Binatia bacterium]
MATMISPKDLRALIENEQTYALFDVREVGEYNVRHIASATPLPRSEIEFRIAGLVTAPSTLVVLYDDSSGRAELAANTLQSSGYELVHVLRGGAAGWAAGGYATASGVNVPSKEFGERIHVESHVPELTPEELHARKERGERMLIWDVRTPEEYSRFSIPGSCNVPGGDLIEQAYAIAEDPNTPVVIHCAGRTRSIIGTQSLLRLGLRNVLALKNGTMGWQLAGFDLEQRPNRRAPDPSPQGKSHAESLAARIVQQEGIPLVCAEDLDSTIRDRTQSPFYLFDVRSREEYRAGHIPNSRWVPGGQAVQRADDFVAVRTGTIVFACDSGARSVMTAYWYKKMGFKNIFVLQGGIRSWSESGRQLEQGTPCEPPPAVKQAQDVVRWISGQELAATVSDALILDVGKSSDYERGHIPGARWLSRGWLEVKMPELFPDHGQLIVVTCPDGQRSTLAGKSLQDLRYKSVFVLKGGTGNWLREARPTGTGLAGA